MLNKRFNFKDVESELLQSWSSKGIFEFKIQKGNQPFCIMMPPPNVTGSLHICRKSEDKCGNLYEKMKLVQEVMDANPGGPYKRILREQHNMVI